MERHHMAIIAVVALGMSFIIGNAFGQAGAFNAALPNHPLQQIQTTATSGISLDADGDGIVDQTNTALGVTDGSITGASIADKSIKETDVDDTQICTSNGGSGCSAASAGALSCTNRTTILSSGSGTANCVGAEKITGGGVDCRGANITQSNPTAAGYTAKCATTSSGQVVYATCCLIG